jgi:hypothetical protein
MNLLQIRTWFVQESGRYDLVVDTAAYADNGANKYLNAAMRMLDRMQTTKFTEAHFWKQALVTVKHVTFGAEFRSIHAAFATKESDSSRTELEKLTLKEIKEQHFGYLGGTVDAGSPLYYSPAVFRLGPEAEMAIGDIDVPANYLDYIGESPYKYNGILFSPPCDESYSIEVWGYVYSKTLALDADENWWTWNHPELVVMAGQLVLEKMMRNTEGVKDWTAAIKMELQGIDFDLAEEDFANISQLGG